MILYTAGEVMMEFKFSEAHIKKRTKIIFIGLFCCVFAALGFIFYLTNFDVKKSIYIAGIVILWNAVIFIIEVPLIFRSMRKMKVLVLDDKIIKRCGRKE